MKHVFAGMFLSGVMLFLLQAFFPSPASAVAKPLAYVVKLDGVIGPATFDLVGRQLKNAVAENATVVVLEMHTPGGLYDSTQQIIQTILDSPVPVVTYVSPAGSHAASAGTYILYGSHLAAMAPGTNLGAATPVQMSGGGEEKAPGNKALEEKMVNDAAAYLRGLAEMHGRNAEWAEKAVRKAESLTADAALKEKVIDVVATDVADLLKKIHGKSVRMQGGATQTLDTKDAETRNIVPDWRHDLLEIITHPNVAFLLLTLGAYGLVYEFANPGAFAPGVIGAICILLGLFAMNVMPINYAGLALLFIGVAFMVAEAFTPSFGILGIGGGVAFAIGATMLVDSEQPGFGVDPWLIGGMTLLSLGFLSVILALAVRAHRRPAATGREELLSAVGEVLNWTDANGEVRVTGEVWQATAASPVLPGKKVKVIGVQGLRLVVAPHEDGKQ